MGAAIGQVLPLGVGVALSPLPIIAVVLMLGTDRARSNGPAFLVGWIVGLGVVGTLVLLLAGGAGPAGERAAWVSWVKLALGALLLVMALRTWRGRPRGESEAAVPGWMASLDSCRVPRAVAIGAALSGPNPKNLMLTLGACAAIVQTGTTTGEQFGALAVFVVVASLGIAVPVLVYFAGGTRAQQVLGGWKAWMAQHNAAIMTVVLLLLGTKLLGDALTGLSAG